ncbi:PepSY domain-containing protein [Bacillus sp. TL12]|uniref:PepSY domain-containing protein n=1 Tax=Bacillus sp. TL12 TaxID=2894756 RepID=UPI001F521171|nr:PepSY domain-containing protein [Bacillus sp. TL12]MCI0766023.1 PepSY domain-containing protein [Bacillus sp. TL12]
MYERILMVDYAQGIALKQVPGNVERIKMHLIYGVMFYKFYISAKDNKRFIVEVDARSGNVLGVREIRPDSD